MTAARWTSAKALGDLGDRQVPPYRARRVVVNDAMDILGGKESASVQQLHGRLYQQLPIAITVEGANILTRNLIVFGQERSAAIPTCCAK